MLEELDTECIIMQFYRSGWMLNTQKRSVRIGDQYS
jgi:hypothetical protein